MILSIMLLAIVTSGQEYAARDRFGYRPENLPENIYLYVKRFIADSFDTEATIVKCQTHLLDRTTNTKKYLIIFPPNQKVNDQSFRPFGALELSDKYWNTRHHNYAEMRIQVQRSFWIQLMFHKFDLDPDYKEGYEGCRQVYMSIGYRDDSRVDMRYCGRKSPWHQVREHIASVVYIQNTHYETFWLT